MFTITITTPDLGILTALANAAVKAGLPPTETISATVKPTKTPEAPTRAATPEPVKEKAEAVPAFLKNKAAEKPDDKDIKDLFEKVKQGTTALVQSNKEKGREMAVATLMQFGAGKASDLNPKDYGAYLAAVEALLGNKKEEDLA